jgi:hypothetical protein
VDFRFVALRLWFAAQAAIQFPEGNPANVLRGAFGHLLRRTSSLPSYQRLFEPFASDAGPSGLRNRPRPFVFRAGHLDGTTIKAGENFWFGVNLFDLSGPPMASLLSAFRELAREGLGPARGRAELLERTETAPMTVSLSPGPDQAERVRVRFLTPTELKRGDRIVDEPDFGTLACRVRDRISTLRGLYGDGPLRIDFRSFSERAAQVRLTRCEIRHVELKRRSSRTGQTHPIGGFTGIAEYEGELAEFVPYLRAAKWTGVGRQTVWGKGEIEVEKLD